MYDDSHFESLLLNDEFDELLPIFPSSSRSIIPKSIQGEAAIGSNVDVADSNYQFFDPRQSSDVSVNIQSIRAIFAGAYDHSNYVPIHNEMFDIIKKKIGQEFGSV